MNEVCTGKRAYRMRVYPTLAQRRVLGRLFGAKRKVWNWALERRESAYRVDGARLNWVALSREFTELRCAPETAWLSELAREPFNQVLRDLERAYQNFFAKRAERPRRRRFGTVNRVRFTLDQRREQVARGTDRERWAYIDLPGLGRVKLRRTEALLGRLRSVTLSRDGAGRHFAAITADGVPLIAPAYAKVDAVGVDAGLRDLAVVHDGTRTRPIPAPKAMARGMGRRGFSRSVADASLGELRRQITYKGAWAGREVVTVDTFYPSSKTCSTCGAVNGELKLQKHWECPACGTHHDRDVNAAKNIRAEGLRVLGARGSSPATGERPGSDARGVACAADAAQRATVVLLQRRPTMNREPAQRSAQAATPARTETPRAPSGTGRRRVRAGL
jgi:putative transposase